MMQLTSLYHCMDRIHWWGCTAHMLICKPHAAPMCRLQQRRRYLCILVHGADCMNDMLRMQLEAPARNITAK